jgi:hypothetical protein
MEHPSGEGEFESLDSLAPTLRPIFEREVGPRFLAWSDANAKAWASKESQTELQLDGRRYYQKTFKYPAATLGILKAKYQVASQSQGLVEFLSANGCLPYLQTGQERSESHLDPLFT